MTLWFFFWQSERFPSLAVKTNVSLHDRKCKQTRFHGRYNFPPYTYQSQPTKPETSNQWTSGNIWTVSNSNQGINCQFNCTLLQQILGRLDVLEKLRRTSRNHPLIQNHLNGVRAQIQRGIERRKMQKWWMKENMRNTVYIEVNVTIYCIPTPMWENEEWNKWINQLFKFKQFKLTRIMAGEHHHHNCVLGKRLNPAKRKQSPSPSFSTQHNHDAHKWSKLRERNSDWKNSIQGQSRAFLVAFPQLQITNWRNQSFGTTPKRIIW